MKTNNLKRKLKAQPGGSLARLVRNPMLDQMAHHRTEDMEKLYEAAKPRLPRYPGRTYVMMRPGDPWHACHVTILAWTSSFLIGGIEYFDCYLPKRWRKIAKAQQEETRPVRRSELW